MNIKAIHISSIFRHFIFIMVLFAMLLQPLRLVVELMLDVDHTEYAQFDGEEESDEKENEHEENEFEDEIIKVSDTNTYKVRTLEDIEISTYKILQPNWDFNIEIPIPPPQLLYKKNYNVT